MKLLFIRLSALGDVILTTGVLKLVHEKLPDAIIEVLTSDQYHAIFASLPFISAVHTIDRAISLGNYLKMLRTLPEYDYIFDLHSNTRSFFARKILKGKSYKYSKDGFKRRMFVKFRLFKLCLQKHVVEKYAQAVLPPLGIAVPSDIEALRPWLPRKNAARQGRVIVHPFASKNTKIWTYFPELVEKLQRAGYEVAIIGNGNFAVDKVERLHTPSMEDMFARLSEAELLITTDSGPLHAGIALNVPSIAIFGSTTKEFGFYPVFQNCNVVETDLKCRPCHVHGLNACPKGHFRCIKDISVEDVLTLIN